jgi:hypothetical protein
MEDVLDVYTRPIDETPECPKQLIGETRLPIPAQSGKPECFDTEYVRNGVCEIFMFTAPLTGWRRAEITERRTRQDWARQIQKLVDEDFPNADKIILVMATPISPLCTQLLHRKKQIEFVIVWKFIIRLNTVVGGGNRIKRYQ